MEKTAEDVVGGKDSVPVAPVQKEENARALDGASGDDNFPRFHGKEPAIQTPRANGFHASARVEREITDCGAEPYLRTAFAFELLTQKTRRVSIGDRYGLGKAGYEIELSGLLMADHFGRLVWALTDAKQLFDVTLVAGEGFHADGPYGVPTRDGIGVLWQERDQGAAPSGGGAPKATESSFLGALINSPSLDDLIERVPVFRLLFLTRLDDDDAQAFSTKENGDNETDRASADNGDVGLQLLVRA
nr:hypothetical protein [Methylocystis iwaonis]